MAATKYEFGYLCIQGGRAPGAVTFYTEDETYASIRVQDDCPGDGHYLSAWVQIQKNGDDDALAYVTARGHSCGYGANSEFVNALYFDHQRARLVVCRYPTDSYPASRQATALC